MLASAPGLAVSNVQPDVPAISSIVPAVDHHQHLLSPAGAAWLNRIPAPAEAVPGDVAALLAERARRWNDAAGLAELYLPDATVLSELDPVFHSGREGREYLSKRFARPFDLVPRAFRQVGGEC